jgi:hypothetical protein
MGIFGVAQPVPRILDGDAVTLVAMGALFGLGRGRNLERLVHGRDLSALTADGKGKIITDQPCSDGLGSRVPGNDELKLEGSAAL